MPHAEHPGALVGRVAELAELSAALDGTAQGNGALRLLVGEAGIGKTRLADEASTRAAAAGFTVAWGRTWEAGGAPPLWPWLEVLRTLGAEAALAGADGSEAERFRAFGAARDALRALAGRAPVLVVLDDLHAADEATLDLLLFVARGLRGTRVALLGTARDAEARRLPTLEGRLARIAREGRRLDLAPLAPEEVAELASRVSPGLSAEQVERVVHASEGNPLFADELARLIGQRGDGREAGARTLPDGVRAVVLSRLGGLPPSARRVLEAASVLGRAFDVPALEMLGADATGGRVREGLALAAAASGLVAPVPGRAERHAFSHVLVRDAIYHALAPDRRAALHHAHSLRLEACPGTPAAERAFHALLGLPAGSVDRAVALAREAAERASAMGAYADSAAFLERALQALGPSREPALRCDVAIGLAEAEARAGLGQRSRETAERAADLARALSDPVRLARAVLALGFTTTLGVVNLPLVRALREALDALGERDRGLAARLTARLASALQPAPDPDEPIALALRAIELARGSGDRPTLLATLYAACSALGDLAGPDVRAPPNAECAELAAALGDLAVEQRALARLAIDLVELGRLAEADRAIAEVEALGERLALPSYRWRPLLLRSMRALMAGRLEESGRLVSEAERHARADGGFDAEVAIIIHRLGMALVSGTVPADVESIVSMLAARLAYGAEFFRVMELEMMARLGRVERVRALTAEAAGWADPSGAIPLADLQFGSALGEALAAAGDTSRCIVLLERLRGAADREVTWGMMGLVDVGPLSGVLAVLAAAAGRPDEALGWFERALARCVERGLGPIEAGLRAERATLLTWLGREAEAAPDRERARTLAAAMGLEPSRILRTREALGLSPYVNAAPPPAPESRPGPRGAPPAAELSLVREGDVWAIHRGEAVFRVRHVRGLEMLAALLAHPERAFPAVDLDLAGESTAAGAGDAGEVLDARARDAYRRRAADLQGELAEAEAFQDAGRVARLREELETLAEELARGVGLGGRTRRAGSRVERSRVNVQRRLKDAIARIAEHDPALGRHLERAVRTGTVCV